MTSVCLSPITVFLFLSLALSDVCCHCFYLFSYIFSIEGVYVLECDVGQTEFTPPGCVSLHYVTQPLLGKILRY